MKIAVLGAHRVGSDDRKALARRPRRHVHGTPPGRVNLAIARAAPVADAAAAAEAMLVAVPAAVKHLSPEMQITTLREE